MANKENYLEYLLSPEWQAKRAERLKLDNYKCTVCGQEDFLEVHHLTYVRLGRERMEDLRTLCEDCHEDGHGLKPSDSFAQFRREQKRYRKIFIEQYGSFPHPCYFNCGKNVEGYTVPCDRYAAVVHHIDGNPLNNSSENLATGHWGCHSSYHNKGRVTSPDVIAKMAASNSTPQKRARFSASAIRRWENAEPEEREKLIDAQTRGRPTASCIKCRREIRGKAQIELHVAACNGQSIVSQETRNKISEAQLGKNNKWYGTKGPMHGKHHTAEANAKRSASLKATYAAKGGHSEETRRKIGESNAKSLKGTKQSAETVVKRTATMKQKWQDPEFRAAHKAGVSSPEARKKNSESNRASRILTALICDICGQEIRGGAHNLARHKAWKHSEELPVQDILTCDECGKECRSPAGLTSHKRSHLPETRYRKRATPRKPNSMPIDTLLVCEICGAEIVGPGPMATHMRFHSLPAVPCPVCGKGIKGTGAMTTHMRSHTTAV